MTPESLDRRAFLRGLTLTSAGLLVPRTTFAKSVSVLPTTVFAVRTIGRGQ